MALNKSFNLSLFGLRDQVNISLELMRKYEPPEGYYLCFSGGKDSVVLYDLAVKSGVKFDAHHNITTVEPPELMRFIIKNYPDVVNERPPISMHDLIVKKGMPPLRTARYCCFYLKERGGLGRVKMTGIRAGESARRAKRKNFERSKIRHDDYFLHPIHHWSENDIWQYIHDNGLPYCELYDRGRHRVGCVLCPYQNAHQVELDLRDFPGIVKCYQRACKKSYEVNGDRLRRFTSGEDMFQWWIQRLKKTEIAEDCNSVPLFSEDDGFIL